jgi:DNA-binding SARP family transcriptional activator
MRFQLLGTLRIGDGTTWSEIRAAQQRLVLAILLIEAGQVVSTDRLIDEIWGERPPRAAVGTIQGYVMHLRRALGGRRPERGLRRPRPPIEYRRDGAGTLVTRGRGYQLDVEPDDLDATVFERTVDAGKRSLAGGDLTAAVAALADALALWRGPAMADVPATPTVVAEAQRLEQARLAAIELRLGAQLDLGQHTEVVGELHRLVQEHPLREGLWAQLMLALFRSGRRAEALDAYQQARTRLVDELGLEPGQQLRQLQADILGDAPTLSRRAPVRDAAVTPAQLPPDVAGFTGRDAQLARLDGLLPAPDDRHPTVLVISTIAGTAGVGKTALATHWGHRVAGRFPDGQLYVNLRGYGPVPALRPIAALARFLHALGVPPSKVPMEEDEAAALFRSLVAGKRMLVLLDNAAHPDQVRPLLPGGPGCLVLVTSRDHLGGLVARDGAVRLTLDVLTPDEAGTLLARLVGADRVRAEPEATARLAALCGYLPLAIRIAAANLVAARARPAPGAAADPNTTIEDYTRLLAEGDRLGALEVDGDPHASVRIAFGHSYAALPPAAARLFRLLGLVPGPNIDAAAAAALAGVSPAEAAEQLERLSRAHLVEEPQLRRYTFHDLLRRHAAERASAEDSEAGRHAAVAQLFDYYLRRVAAAAELVFPQILRTPLPSEPPAEPVAGFANHAEASAWLDAERPNLVAAVVHAKPEFAGAAWRLADALRGYLYQRMYIVDWASVADAGLTAADADGDPRGRAAAQAGLATLHWVQGRHLQAVDHYQLGLILARQAGWVEGESAALGNLGNLYWALGKLRAAGDHYTQALALFHSSGHVAGQATVEDNLGLVSFWLGDLDVAVEHYTRAIGLHQGIGSRSGETRTLTHLGDAHRVGGRLDEALATLTAAVATAREIGDRNVEGDAVRNLARVHRDAGRLEQALEHAQAALELARETGDQRLVAGALTTRASVDEDRRRYAQAIDGHRRALGLAREVGNRPIEAEALIGLAAALRKTGQLDSAAEHARQALEIAQEDGYRLLEAGAAAELHTGSHSHH